MNHTIITWHVKSIQHRAAALQKMLEAKHEHAHVVLDLSLVETLRLRIQESQAVIDRELLTLRGAP